MYYMVLLIGTFLSMVNDKKRISFKIFALILAILAFLRYGVGADYFAYNYLYDRLGQSLITEIKHGLDNQEMLFRYIGTVFKKIGFSYQQYLIIIAIVNLYYICKICKKYSKNPSLSLLIYFCFYYFVWTFSGLRQGITLSVGVYYLLESIENKNTIKIILISLLLSLIHTSAIILIPLYIFSRISFNKKSLIVISLIAILTSTIPILNILVKFTWMPFINKLMPYIDQGAKFSIMSIFSFKSLGRLLFLLIGLFYYNVYSDRDKASQGVINTYVLSLILYFLLKSSELAAARLSIYGMFLNVLILPNIYYMYKNKLNKLIYIGFLSTVCILFFYKEIKAMEEQSGFQNSTNLIMPYTNIYNKDKYFFDRSYLLDLNP